jgi:hypothetical protein
MLAIAVQGCTLQSTGNGTNTIVSPPSNNCKIDNKGIYKGVLTITTTGNTLGSWVQTAPATGTIIPTSTSTTNDNEKVVRVTDKSAVITCDGLVGNVPTTNTVTVTIIVAGQTSVLSD